MKFTEMGLPPELLSALKELSFETPTPIQEQAIPRLLEGNRDLIGLASTGTGKTAAFGLPLIERIDVGEPRPQALVLCPTRELCLQISGDLKRFAKHKTGAKIAAVYGGANISNQMRELRRGAQVVVATPGRLIDLIKRGAAKLDDVRVVVLDEADEMLNMGFKDELDRILSSVPETRSVWLFSATMAKGVERIAREYLRDPIEISVGGRNEAAANIEHYCFMVHEKDRYPALKRILDYLPGIYGLVFCRTRAETQQVAEKLMADGYPAEALHGDLSQAQRDYVMRKFRNRSVPLLVATDVAARGLDVDDISHVIHYRLSDEAAAYTHRSGRTARAGKSGVSIALINLRERRRIQELERRNNVRIRMEKIPDARAICERQLLALIDRVVECEIDEEEIRDYLPPAYEALCGMEKKEIIKRFVAVEFNRYLDYYRDAGDINAKSSPRRERQVGDRSQRSSNQKRRAKMQAYDVKRFFINVGRVHQINAGAILRLVCENAGIPANLVGTIDVGRDRSVFEVSKDASRAVREGLANVRLDGRKVSVRSAGK